MVEEVAVATASVGEAAAARPPTPSRSTRTSPVPRWACAVASRGSRLPRHLPAAMQSNHGYPSPLVTRPRVPRGRSGAPRYLARRWREADDREQCVSDAAAVLNALESARARGSLVWVEPRRATSSAGVTASGDAVFTRLGRFLAAQYPRPSEPSCPDGTLCELFRAKDLYSEVTAS